MKCEDLLKALSDYIDGEIDPSICKEFEEHLRGCEPCKIVIDTVRKTILLYKDAEVYELPYELKQRIHSLLREKWKEKFPAAEC
ncbi:MAG: zf-HC2 domain-containing protein [Armatimonadetes bacterium]|nr:zf-HC2 domain-containing protein [Armatimonadota bacterium]